MSRLCYSDKKKRDIGHYNVASRLVQVWVWAIFFTAMICDSSERSKVHKFEEFERRWVKSSGGGKSESSSCADRLAVWM